MLKDQNAVTPVRLEPTAPHSLSSAFEHGNKPAMCPPPFNSSRRGNKYYKSDINGTMYSKTCVKRPLSKRQKYGFQDQLSLNTGQKYCRMLPLEHSAILSTFIKLPVVIKTFDCLFLSGRFFQVSR